MFKGTCRKKNKKGWFKIMIKIENTVTPSGEQWERIIMGLRNPMNSWDKSDTIYGTAYKLYDGTEITTKDGFSIGNNDLDLMKRLVKAGTDHRKFMRMIVVYADITAPDYWFKEFSTYRVGVTENSTSTMHRIQSKEFTLDDFSTEHLFDSNCADRETTLFNSGEYYELESKYVFKTCIIALLNFYREKFLETNDKNYWWQLIQLLPMSYNYRRTVCLNYEVLANMYHSRKAHKLDEWREFCKWVETLPYSELITGNKGE